MIERVLGNERTVERLAEFGSGYRGAATASFISAGPGFVYFPVNCGSNVKLFLDLLRDPSYAEAEKRSFVLGNSGSRQRFYPNLESAIRCTKDERVGRLGFVKIDVIAKKVVDLLNAEGTSVVPEDYHLKD